jgi:hypothetical protein
MTNDPKKAGRGRRATVASALPDDDEALQGLAAAAFLSPAPSAGAGARAVLSAVREEAPAPTAAAPALPAAGGASAATPAPAEAPPALPAGTAPDAAQTAPVPAPDPNRDFIRQATIGVDAGIVARFREYQRKEANRTKVKPSNLDVVFAALRAAKDRERAIVQSHQPKVPDGERWGRPVPGRRSGGPRLSSQINYRPTVGELADITQLAEQSGAESVSAFLNMLLDDFLPASGSRAAPQP